ncbi:hypothetical protein HPP92_002028 [Vanilla planifolia]|uniref:RING-CH-type domain-containing protein n=1 Tax=Vanilla planifolia TaxID=51239 RepID=A0A835S4I3_VANPL|nr:hypothetical protein HPP92_002028 [Vanilla planifolia]
MDLDEAFGQTGSPSYLCRICHDEEESPSCMESPCSCSGTLKFAHRRCTQRWCDEKGATSKFEPNYSVKAASTAETHLVDVAVTIRGSLEVPRYNYEPQRSPLVSVDEDRPERGYNECSLESNRRAQMLQIVPLTFAIMLLLKHLIALQSAAAEDYAFTLATVFLLRAVGILFPFFCIMRLITEIHKLRDREMSFVYEEEEDDLEHQGHFSTESS